MDHGDDMGGEGFTQETLDTTGTNKKTYDLNTTLNDINSLEDLKNYYAALKEINAERYAAGGWGLGAANMKRGKSGTGMRTYIINSDWICFTYYIKLKKIILVVLI